MKTAKYFLALLGIVAGAVCVTPVRAQWNQNTGTGPFSYTNTANWNGGNINNIFQTNITTGAIIQFGGNYTLSSAMLLGWSNNANVTFESSSSTAQTISFGSGGGITVTNAVGGTITVGTSANPLILNLNGNSNCIIGGVSGSSGSGNVTMNVNAQITDSSGGTNGVKLAGDRVFTYLLNTNNNFTGPVNFYTLRGGGFANIKPIGGGPSALGAPNDSTNGTVSVADDSSNGSLQYSGSGDTSDRPFNWAITFNSTYANAYQFENVGTGKLKLSGQWTLPSSTNSTQFIVNAASNNIELDGYFKGSGGGTYILFEGSGNSTNQVFLNGPTNDFTGFEVTSGVLAYNTISNAGAQSSLGTNGTLIVRAGGTLQYLGTNSSTTNNRTILLTCPPSGTAATWNLDNGNTNTLTLSTISLTNFANTSTSAGTNGPAGARTLGLNVFTAADAGPYGTLTVPAFITDLSSTNSVQVVAGGAVGFPVFNGGTVSLLGQTNTFSGGVQIKYDRTLQVMSLADSNVLCSIGTGASPASGFTAITFGSTDSQRGGTLAYIGNNNVASCNRQMSVLGTTGGANNFSILNNSPNNSSVHFSATGPIIYTTTNMSNCAVTLGGTAVATNILDATITNSPTGNATLTVSGSTWALTATNTYAGGTTISAGTLQVGNGGNAGFPGTGPITNKSSLVYFHTNTVTNLLNISGTGSLTHNGSGTLALAVSNSYSGGTTVNAGTLDVQHDGCLGTGNVTVASGATLELRFGVNNTYIAPTANLLLEPGSPAVNLAFSGSPDNINELSFDGGVTFKAAGTWGAPGSGATFTSSLFTGAGILNVTNGPASATAVASSVPSSTYGQSVYFTASITPATATGTVQFQVDGTNFGAAAMVSSGSAMSGSTTTLSAGAHAINAIYSGDDNFGPSTGTNAQSVAPASLMVTANNQSKTYGQTVTFGSGSTAFTSSALQNGETIGSVTLACSGGASNAPVPGSPYTITASAATGGTFNPANYNITYNGGLLTVGPAALTVTADNYSIPFGATNPVLGVTYSNFVNGETLGTSDVQGSPALTTGATTNSDVGNYVITNGIGTLTSTNYTFSLVSGTLTITNAVSSNLVASIPNPGEVGAGLTFTSTLSTLAPSLAVPTNAVQFVIDGVTNATPVYPSNGVATVTNASLAAGSHTIEADYAGDTNVLGATNILGSTNVLVLTVNATPVFSSLTAAPAIAYGAASVSLSGTVSAGSVYPTNGENVTATINGHTVSGSVIDNTGDFTINYNDPSLPTDAVGGYTITYAYAGNPAVYLNPAANDTSTSLTVTQASLTITANNDSKTYGQTKTYGAGSTAFTSSALQNGETIGTVTITDTGSGGVSNAPVSGSPYPLVPSAATGGTFNPANYNITYNNGMLTVAAASLSVTANNQSKTYGQTVAFGSGSTAFTSSALQNGETIGSVTLACSGGASNAPVAGSPYTITASAATGGTFNPANYNITYNSGLLTIGPAALTVMADDYSVPFGATNPVFGVTYSNFVNGETLGTSDVQGSPALTTCATTNSDVGAYVITNSIGTLTSSNYTFSLVNGTLTITNAVSSNTMAASPNPALPGALVTFTSTLSTLSPSMAVPTNSVQFFLDGSPYGDTAFPSNGVATIGIVFFSHGYHTIEADYAGDTNALGATNILGSTNTVVELINTPPVAGPATYGRQADLPLNIPIASLLTNASDADGDAITLVSVSSPSTNGATVTTNATMITYTPPATNGNVTDTFTYTVADTFGATSTGTVTIFILPNSPPLTITGIMTQANGTELLNFSGVPNFEYIVQATTNLTPPAVWTALSTNTADTNGLFQFTDLGATNYPARYYRTTVP